jgi:hypothetical protein
LEAAQQKLPLWSARTVFWNRHCDVCYNNAPKAGVPQGCTEQHTSGASAWSQHATIHWVGEACPGPRYQCIVYTNHPHMCCIHASHTCMQLQYDSACPPPRWSRNGEMALCSYCSTLSLRASERYYVHGHCLCSSGYFTGQHVTHEYVRINRIATERLWPDTP